MIRPGDSLREGGATEVEVAIVGAGPVGIAVANDGSLFVTEDANGTIWRVSYGK